MTRAQKNKTDNQRKVGLNTLKAVRDSFGGRTPMSSTMALDARVKHMAIGASLHASRKK